MRMGVHTILDQGMYMYVASDLISPREAYVTGRDGIKLKATLI